MEGYYKTSKKKIAIIDSGIDLSKLDKNIILKKTRRIFITKKKNEVVVCIEDSEKFDDLHGTYVAQIISKYSQYKEIECYSYNVFDNKIASSYSVYEALLECLQIPGLNMIVMSISCKEYYRNNMCEVLRDLKKKGVAIFSAVKNGVHTSFPADCDYVYGVSGGIYTNHGIYEFHRNSEIDFIADHAFEFLRCNNRIHVFGGNSKANAIIAGKYIDKDRDIFREGTKAEQISVKDLLITIEYTRITNQLLDELQSIGIQKEKNADDQLINYWKVNVDSFERMMKKYIPGFDLCNVEYIRIATINRVIKYLCSYLFEM